MNYKYLYSFLVLSEELHFAKAANRLHITQPALSQHIQIIEDKIGLNLFKRNKRSVELTFEGEILVNKARSAVSQYEDFILTAKNLHNGIQGRLKIGYVGSSLLDPMFIKITNSYNYSYPNIELYLIEKNVTEQLDLIMNNDIDIAVIREPIPHIDKLKYCTINTNKLVIAIPKNHKLAKEKKICLSTLENDTFLIQEDPHGVGLGWSALSACYRAGIKDYKIIRTKSVSGAIGLVSMSKGVSIVPHTARLIKNPYVKFIEIDDPLATTSLSMCWKNENNKILSDFIAYIKPLLSNKII